MITKNEKLMQNGLTTMVEDFLSLIYPRLCICCDGPLVKQERVLCTKCTLDLPRTHFHLIPDNPVEQLFWGRTHLEKATSYFLFQKGSRYQKLLHYLKYKGFRIIGTEMGSRFGAELKQNSYFDEADVLVPVPLHPKKERKRGYNQSLAIAEGLALQLHKPISHKNLYRKHSSETQTSKGRYERWENVSELFDLHEPGEFAGKHVLLIDDVVTTGSTLEACAGALHRCNHCKVSIATLAFASI